MAALCLVLLGMAGCERRRGHAVERYPERSIELIVPWTPGGGSDRLARFVADALQRRLGQPVVVVNRTGGGGSVGHTAGALGAPDGYTLTLGTFELGTMRAMGISQVTPDDFQPVAMLNADAAALLVRADARWADLKSLLETARSEPGRLRMSGTASGGVWDLARSGLMLAAGIPPTNVTWVPAPGSAPAMVELLGGHIDVVCCSVPEAWAQVESGQVRVLSVMARERLADFASIPTAREQGVDFEAMTWRGLFVPLSTPPEIVERLSLETMALASSEAFQAFMKKNGFAPRVESARAFASYLKADAPRWREVIRSAGYESLGRNRDPGPSMFPRVLGGLLVAAGFWEAIRARRKVSRRGASGDSGFAAEMAGKTMGSELGEGGSREPSVGAVRGFLPLVAGLVAYVAVLPWVGFSVATAGFGVYSGVRFGANGWRAAAMSAGLVAVIHVLFVMLFKVPLP